MNKRYVAGVMFVVGLGVNMDLPDGPDTQVFAFNTAHAASADQKFLKGFTGKWRGRGTLDISGTGKREPISCKSQGRLNGATGFLIIEGQCSTQDGSGGFRINLGFSAAKRLFTGSMLNTAKHNITTLSGRRSGNVLSMSARGSDANLKSRRLTISLRGARTMSISGRAISRKTGARLNTGTITFRRR